MKVAIIYATDGSPGEDVVLAPFRSANFIDGLRGGGLAPLMIAVAPDHVGVQPVLRAGDPSLRCQRDELAALLASERPQAIQTFGPEHRLAAIWQSAAPAGVPIVHCVSCWRNVADAPPPVLSFATSRAKRASGHVTALVGTSRAAVGGLMAGGYFPHATSSVIVAPPVERAAAVAQSPSARTAEPVFGIYDPNASPDLVAFVARAIELSGQRNALQVRIAVREPSRLAATPVSLVAAEGIDGFLAAIDVLAVPVYDDAGAAPLIAALRAGKSVIAPDPSGAAELIEYGRHGLMFSAGSAYHFANAMDIVSQSWSQRPVLLADGGPAIARTEPAMVSRAFAAIHRQLVSHDEGATSLAEARRPSHG
jgi:hypothetical protein